MKCEICHKADAETAISREVNGAEDELYVCKACARAERARLQKKSHRTRKVTGLPNGIEMSVTEFSGDGDEPPPFIHDLVNALNGVVEDIQQHLKSGNATASDESTPKVEKDAKHHEFPCSRVDAAYRFRGLLHLEGLHLIGELEAVQRAVRALGATLDGMMPDGVKDAGHVYGLAYSGTAEQAKRIVKDILQQERNARVRLYEEMPRLFGDALGRSLAILKNCRLLAPGELFDMLSPLRLAALEGLLDGCDVKMVEALANELKLDSSEDMMTPDERDRVDAERADAINRQFEDVVLNERAEGMHL